MFSLYPVGTICSTDLFPALERSSTCEPSGNIGVRIGCKEGVQEGGGDYLLNRI